MVYAQIKNGIVKNTIVIDDVALEAVFVRGFDHLVRIDELDTVPGIDWAYDGECFLAPVAEE